MFASVVIGIIVLIIVMIVYVEYKNEKTYQEERQRRSEARRKPKHPRKPEEKIQKPVQKKETIANRKKAPTPDAKKPVTPAVKKEEEKTAPLEENILQPSKIEKKTVKEEMPSAPEKKQEKTLDLPTCEYPEFNYSRLLKMGLSEEESIEFIKELIPQLKTQIPLIKEALDKKDFHSMERLTHSIKGSSTTVGTGGVSDLLVAYNTYLKTGKDLPVAEAYFKHLKHYTEELEKEFA